jgi:hypothetical protein
VARPRGLPCRSLSALALAAAAALTLLGWGARPAAAAAPPPSRQEVEQLLDQADGILAQIGRLRGLEPPSPLTKAIRPQDAIVRRYLELLRDRYPGPRLDAERKALVKFALIPPDFPLEKFLGDMAGEQVAAYYDHLNGEIVLADWLPAAIQAPVLTHELVHALQDRYLDLRKFLAPRPGRSDFLAARDAILEGEATAVMADLLLQPTGLDITRLPDLGPLAEQAAGRDSPILKAAPKFLRDQLLFPYTAGTAFVTAFRRAHPWPAFTQVYRDPPRSTEQILHPEKYLGRRDDPQVVLLPDVRGVLGSGWTLALEDDAGEFAVRGILERFLPEAEARAAAEGWGGDQYHLYERAEDGELALVFLTAWDTEADAREFAAAYARLIPMKYAAARAGRAGEGMRRWTAGGGTLLVERRASDVLVLEGVPPDRTAAVRQWVWRFRSAQR